MFLLEGIGYLANGNDRQQQAFRTLTSHHLFDLLQPFQPVLAGTIPLAIDIPGSDLDLICCWEEEAAFAEYLTRQFSRFPDFECLHKSIRNRPTVIARFTADDFPVEIFGQNRPSTEQEAVRHLLVEFAILQEKGEAFRQAVIDLKMQGMKTEPAFWKLLGMEGDGYEGLLGWGF
ncbi:MAG: DUF4269 domain-containing protein [Saprospiraceae bacterium]|nr:DUF4269 domain-containing protein [Saprospiraceae bacterium]